ncbi:flagellar hook-basal body complex protein FliE [Sporolactobacillus vineae]|uniref:flagellar hook-basal body complex protein FliE n=1 Tax=Sporolactobacillus vineae TaxID=444463 RepID=UPI000288B57F|nr:flagellar hook-basal body complex protein FliE [Sporolactobacillus vineae]
MVSVAPVSMNQAVNAAPAASQSAAGAQTSFSNALNQALGTVNQSVTSADQMVTGLANGSSNADLHSVMIAMQKADVLLKTTVQVRDRVVAAYQEIMRMQV